VAVTMVQKPVGAEERFLVLVVRATWTNG